MLFKSIFTVLPSLLSGITKLNRMSCVNYYADAFLDRCSEQRKDMKWITDRMTSKEATFILFHVDRPFVANTENKLTDASGTSSVLYKIDYVLAENFIQKNCIILFLGLEYKKLDDTANHIDKSAYAMPTLYDRTSFRPWFAIDTSSYDDDPDKISMLFNNEGSFLDGNYIRLANINTNEASILAQARSLFCWHDRNKFCATCGTQTHVDEGGYKRTCPNQLCKSNDKQLHKYVPSNICYPRVDPVVIMLVVNQQKTHFLLGRKKTFPKNMFSCLAGFLEVGESIEEAVKREVFEECGIYTSHVVFHSSQPWPFPSNIMIGCVAYAVSNEIKVDQNELEEAKWFSLDEIELIIKNQHPQSVFIPPSRAIANKLINYWYENKSKL